jgi:ureidoacrylate peracid hydrolase
MFKEMSDKDLFLPKHTALLIIDLQNDYCSKKGKVSKIFKFNVEPIEGIISDMKSFLSKAREKNIQVIWTRMIEDYKNSRVKKNMVNKILSQKNPVRLCILGTSGFDYYKLKPEKEDFEVIKSSYDPFTNAQLQKILKKKKIKNLVVMGVYTSICVESAVRRAFSEGYNVIVPKNLVAMPKEEEVLHNSSIKNMQKCFAYIINSMEILNAWEKYG